MPTPSKSRTTTSRIAESSFSPRLLKKVQMQGGARSEARGVLTGTSQRRGSAPTPQMGLFQLPAKGPRPTAHRLPTHRPPTHPGEMLVEEFLKPLGMSQAAFAIRLGVSFPRLNEIVRRKRGVTADTALRLERVLGMPADFWLGLQQDWDLWHAMRSVRAAAIDSLEPLRQVG